MHGFNQTNVRGDAWISLATENYAPHVFGTYD